MGNSSNDNIPKNTILLVVKSFLSDVRSWSNNYIDNVYTCHDFTMHILKEATRKNIRCGYVIVFFQNNPIAHALVAFETDHGLQYFEPQTGEEINISVGMNYPVIIPSVKRNNIISKIVILWNNEYNFMN